LANSVTSVLKPTFHETLGFAFDGIERDIDSVCGIPWIREVGLAKPDGQPIL
jgi:hypothetical protein